jgi:hypothetical protein
MPKPKDTGLAAFTEAPEAEQDKPHTGTKGIRTKGKGKWVHNQLRMTHDQWELINQFADSVGTSVNRLALLGISKLREDRGLPRLPGLDVDE